MVTRYYFEGTIFIILRPQDIIFWPQDIILRERDIILRPQDNILWERDITLMPQFMLANENGRFIFDIFRSMKYIVRLGILHASQ